MSASVLERYLGLIDIGAKHYSDPIAMLIFVDYQIGSAAKSLTGGAMTREEFDELLAYVRAHGIVVTEHSNLKFTVK